MTIEFLHNIARIFLCISGSFGLIAIFLLFRFQMWKVVGDLLGTNAKREIKAIAARRRTRMTETPPFWVIKEEQET